MGNFEGFITLKIKYYSILEAKYLSLFIPQV